MTPSFRYQKLDTDEIRLLRFNRSEDVPGRQLSLTIQHFARDKAPAYTALSYEWGKGPDSHNILLNNQKFALRRNLWLTLHHVLWFYECDYLWVDAICTNQNNVQERNEQVSKMGQTYKDATAVLAWLGLDDGSDGTETDIEKILTLPKPKPDDVTLYRSSYWFRMWVIQEIRLAREVDMLWGRHLFTWSRMKILMNLQNLMFEDATMPLPRERGSGVLERYDTPRTLAEFLFSSRYSQCKDPRDKVFALLSIISEEEREILEPFFPDYSMTPEKVQLLTLAYLKNNLKGASRKGRGGRPSDLGDLVDVGYLGIDSEAVWNELLLESNADVRLAAPMPRKKVWSLRFGVQFLLWNRSADAIRKKREDQERLHREWMESRIDGMHAIAAITLR